MRQLDISQRGASDMFQKFRKICTEYFIDNPVQLGGQGIIVEVDESCFSHKPKHHRGRTPTKPLWVFGLVDTSIQPAIGYMEIVEKRNAETLLPIIKRTVLPGTIIHSDEWRDSRIEQHLGFYPQNCESFDLVCG